MTDRSTAFQEALLALLWTPWDTSLLTSENRDRMTDEWRESVWMLIGSRPSDEEDQRIREAEAAFGYLEPPPRPEIERRGITRFASIHPLDGTEIPAGQPNQADVRQRLLDLIRETADRWPVETAGRNERLLLDLWQQLPRSDAMLGRLPGDLAAPYYTIWERQSVISALSVAMPAPALLSFRIGGIQQFIDQARTTEDFWTSSYLISFLTWQAASLLISEFGPTCLLFPSLTEQPEMHEWLRREGIPTLSREPATKRGYGTFPNGLLAVVPSDWDTPEKRIGDAVQERFGKAWTDICRKVREQIPAISERALKIWDRQTASQRVFETFWTLVKWQKGESYADWYSRTSRSMESRKTFRGFGPGREENIKCHVCGQREALQSHEGFDRKLSSEFWDSLRQKGIRYRFRPAERLCAVCVVCRLAGRIAFDVRRGFPSTSSIAATLFLQQLESIASELELDATEFQKWLRGLFSALGVDNSQLDAYPALDKAPGPPWDWFRRVDGDWWYDESYEPARLANEYGEQAKEHKVREAARNARLALGDLRKRWNQFGVSDPPSYLALLTGDGDSVGEWLSGARLPQESESLHPDLRPLAESQSRGERRRVPGIATHLGLSSRLGSLPREIERIVREDLRGVLVYAGGDDFLALAPLAHLATGLDQYGATVKAEHLMGNRFTSSAAALIFSHMDPLGGAIQSVHALLENEAKERMQRAAGVICVRRQSGQETVAGSKWSLFGTSTPDETRAFRLVQATIDAMAADKLSPRFVAHMEALAHGVEDIEAADRLFQLAKVLLRGAWHEETRDPMPFERDFEVLFADASGLWQAQREHRLRYDKPWRHALNLMLAARFLARFQTAPSGGTN